MHDLSLLLNLSISSLCCNAFQGYAHFFPSTESPFLSLPLVLKLTFSSLLQHIWGCMCYFPFVKSFFPPSHYSFFFSLPNHQSISLHGHYSFSFLGLGLSFSRRFVQVLWAPTPFFCLMCLLQLSKLIRTSLFSFTFNFLEFHPFTIFFFSWVSPTSCTTTTPPPHHILL